MKLRRFVKDERGAVLPIVALFILFVAFSVTVLVVDAGALFVERRNMVAAADAGALAGAREMQNRTKTSLEIEEVAKKVAVENGADPLTTTATAYMTGNRYVEVVANKNTNLFFAKTIGIDSSNVQAKASAKPIVLTPSILPFAALETEVYIDGAVNKDFVFFHDDRELTSDKSWSGLLNLDGKMGNTSDITDVLMDRTYELGPDFTTNLNQSIMLSAQGWKNFQDALEVLFNDARELTSDPIARRAYVTGFVPIIDAEAYDPSSKKVLPIIGFAEFTILDLVTGKTGVRSGMPEAFKVNVDVNYQIQYSNGVPSVDYANGAVGVNNENQYKLVDINSTTSIIIGVFTGKILSINDILTGNYAGTLYNEARFDAVTLID